MASAIDALKRRLDEIRTQYLFPLGSVPNSYLFLASGILILLFAPRMVEVSQTIAAQRIVLSIPREVAVALAAAPALAAGSLYISYIVRSLRDLRSSLIRGQMREVRDGLIALLDTANSLTNEWQNNLDGAYEASSKRLREMRTELDRITKKIDDETIYSDLPIDDECEVKSSDSLATMSHTAQKELADLRRDLLAVSLSTVEQVRYSALNWTKETALARAEMSRRFVENGLEEVVGLRESETRDAVEAVRTLIEGGSDKDLYGAKERIRGIADSISGSLNSISRERSKIPLRVNLVALHLNQGSEDLKWCTREMKALKHVLLLRCFVGGLVPTVAALALIALSF